MPDDTSTSTTTTASETQSDSGAVESAQAPEIAGSIGGNAGDGESDQAGEQAGDQQQQGEQAGGADFRSKLADAYLASQFSKPQQFQSDYHAGDAPAQGQQQAEQPLPFAKHLEALETAFEEMGEGLGAKAGKPVREALTALHGAIQSQLKQAQEAFGKQLSPIQQAIQAQQDAQVQTVFDDFASKHNAADLLGGPKNRSLQRRQMVAQVCDNINRAMPSLTGDDLIAVAVDVVRRQVRMPAPGAGAGAKLANGVAHNAQTRNGAINRGVGVARNATQAGSKGEQSEVDMLKSALGI